MLCVWYDARSAAPKEIRGSLADCLHQESFECKGTVHYCSWILDDLHYYTVSLRIHVAFLIAIQLKEVCNNYQTLQVMVESLEARLTWQWYANQNIQIQMGCFLCKQMFLPCLAVNCFPAGKNVFVNNVDSSDCCFLFKFIWDVHFYQVFPGNKSFFP